MDSPPSAQQSRAIRGPLRFEISSSSPQLEAGRPFSVFVKLTNPYDTPTIIQAVTTRVPIEFIDVQAKVRDAERDALASQMQHLLKERPRTRDEALKSKLSAPLSKRLTQVTSVLKGLLPLLPGVGPMSVGISLASITASTLGNAREKMSVEELLTPEDVDEILKTADASGVQSDAMYAAAMRRINDKLRIATKDQDEISLQPGNSVVQLFTLRTNRKIFFSPSSYDLHIQIQYQMDGKSNQDSVPYKLNVRAPLAALIYGSIVGSLCGYLVRDIFEQRGLEKIIAEPTAATMLPWVIALLGNVILGVIVVIAFARKRDAQPILAIEDFWGGLFVGVIAGYTG